MNISIRRVKALINKEFIDFSKNMSLILVCFMPIAIAFMYTLMDKSFASIGTLLATCMSMNVSATTVMIMGVIISEEKEKNTLRALMMSGLSSIEFMLGKTFLTFIISMIINVVLFFVLKAPLVFLLPYLIVSLILTVIMLLVGVLIGLLAKNQSQVGLMATPVMMILFMLPMLAGINETIKTISFVLPSYQVSLMLNSLADGNSLIVGPSNLIVLSVWFIVVAFLSAYTYKVKRFD